VSMARESIRIYEVGPRDGLQNEKTLVPTGAKVALVEGLLRAGLREIEATSFVSPAAVPQMADAAEIIAAVRAPALAGPGRRFTALVVNEKGYDRARAAGCDAIAIVTVVSEALSLRNSRMSVAQSLETCRRVLARAHADGIFARVYLAPAWVCPFEGAIAPDHVVASADVVWEAGASELAIADTIGHAHPLQVGRLFERLAQRFDVTRLAAHLHDTQAMALANAAAAIQAGVRILDASAGGLGGCPFAPGAAGNLATEDLALMATKMGFETGVDLEALWGVVDAAGSMVGRRLGGRTRAWWDRSAEARARSGARDAVAGTVVITTKEGVGHVEA
jgi:hydroxymethylglutaryl-CoA lyase